jgi:hypothetical protein
MKSFTITDVLQAQQDQNTVIIGHQISVLMALLELETIRGEFCYIQALEQIVRHFRSTSLTKVSFVLPDQPALKKARKVLIESGAHLAGWRRDSRRAGGR